ncbi:hypothetical protein Tco_0650411 [Tanacetum coccineum]
MKVWVCSGGCINGEDIDNLFAEQTVTLVDEAQERNDDNLMFDTGFLMSKKLRLKRDACKNKGVRRCKIAEWDNFQAMIDAVTELAARLQAQEQEDVIWKKIQSCL